MEKNNLFVLLKSLTKEEVKDFKKFIASTYFNRGRDLSKYYQVLIKYYPDFNVTKEKICKDYFKTKACDAKQLKILRTLNSEMVKMFETYMQVSELQENRYYQHLILLDKYWRKNLSAFAEKKYFGFLNDTTGVSDDFNQHWQLYSLTLPMHNIFTYLEKEDKHYDLQKFKAKQLLAFFILSSVTIINSMTISRNLMNYKEEKNDLVTFLKNINFEKFLSELDEGSEIDDKIKIEIYCLAIIVDNTSFEKYIEEVLVLYKNSFDVMSDTEKAQYFVGILNRYTHTKKKFHLKSKFELIKFCVEKNLFPGSQFQYMHPTYYKSFFNTGLNIGEIEWSENFYNEYIGKLPLEFKENLTHYSLAYLNHHKQNYHESLKNISDFKFNDVLFTFDMRLMQLKNHYELSRTSESHYETLTYSLDAYNHFLHSNKTLNPSRLKKGKEMIAGINLLNKYYRTDTSNKDNIIFEISKLHSLTGNYWLIEKFDEILTK